MKKALSILISLAIGAALGIALSSLINSISSNESNTTSKIVEMVLLLVALFLGAYLQIILHEAGHLVCGLLTGYRFVSFRVGSLTLIKDANGSAPTSLVNCIVSSKARLRSVSGKSFFIEATCPLIDGKH